MLVDANDLPGGLLLIDDSNRVTAVNASLCHWLGRTSETLVGKPPELWMTPASRIYYLGHVLPSLRLHHTAEEVFLSFSNEAGQELPVLLNASTCATENGGFQLLLMPMQRRYLVEEQLQQARKAAEQAMQEKEKALQKIQAMTKELEQRHSELMSLNTQLEQLATQDALTGLDNRRVYDREIDAHLSMFHRTGLPFVLILADIDWFKQFNDDFGHEAGDLVLKSVGQCLKEFMRDIDSIVRMGGEEFALLLPGTTSDQATVFAERKRHAVENLMTIYGTVTLSFGITEARVGDTKDSLYARADRALYAAKSQGRNRVVTG